MGVSGMILTIVGIGVAGLVVLVGGVVFLAFRKPKKTALQAAADEAKGVLSKGRDNIMEVRRLGTRVKNSQVRGLSDDVCNAAEKIIRTVKEQPESLSQIRQFLNYYLPTLASILSKYVRLEESGVPEPDMTEKTVSFLTDIKKAMDKQYASLFEGDKFDLEVEMEALTIACKRDGLLVGDEFKLSDCGRDISLTL